MAHRPSPSKQKRSMSPTARPDRPRGRPPGGLGLRLHPLGGPDLPHRRLCRPRPSERLGNPQGQDDRRDPAPLLDRVRAGRAPPHRLRQPPRLPLPRLRLDLRGRHLPPDPRRPRRRRPPRHHRRRPRPPARLRHPHRTLVRPRPQPPRPGHLPCGKAHASDSGDLGSALDPETYDYAGAVLFNDHAGELWQRFTTRLRRELAIHAGIPRRELGDHLRVYLGKVANCRAWSPPLPRRRTSRRPGGPCTPPPSWATVDLLTDAIRAAAAHSYTSVSVPAAGDQSSRTFRWGRQLDVRPVKAFGGVHVTQQAVASYVAKYATKAAENTGTLDRRIGDLLNSTATAFPITPVGSSPHAVSSTASIRTDVWAWATCSASAATSRPSPAPTRRPSVPSARNAPTTALHRRRPSSAWPTVNRTRSSS
ncbi:hypothetical protein SCYAM73S_07352 [Streptomyces cyaneofuscatus]